MCGIAGAISLIADQTLTHNVSTMLQKMKHRGPDGRGTWSSSCGRIHLGHQRLSILDTSDAGNQPMHWAERYTITFNGEIFNYLEIKKQFFSDTKFQSHSDTEILLALYELKGKDCLEYLDGQFAFAIWDSHAQTIFCTRDRFGEKPFFYSIKNNVLYFASEIKALQSIELGTSISHEAVSRFLIDGKVYNSSQLESTFYDNISSLKHSHYFILDLSDSIIPDQKKYWDIDLSQKADSQLQESVIKEKIYNLLQDSVLKRLRSDVPIGSSLSGGLDSSIIVCLMNALDTSLDQKVFSARFKNFHKDEGQYIQDVIKDKKIQDYTVYPEDYISADEIQKTIYHQDEPFGSLSIYAQWCVMRLARENNVTVLLDGQGADEIYAGYHHYFNPYLLENAYPFSSSWTTQYEKIKTHTNTFLIDKNKMILRTALPFLSRKISIRKQKNQILNQEFIFEKDILKSYVNNYFQENSPLPNLNKELYKSTMQGGLQELLRYADRNSMAHSVEVRLPFLNHKFVEYAFLLNSNFKINQTETKYILKESFKNILPTSVYNRKDKIGYETPQDKFLSQPRMKDFAHESLLKLQKEKYIVSNLNKDKLDSNTYWRLINMGHLIK